MSQTFLWVLLIGGAFIVVYFLSNSIEDGAKSRSQQLKRIEDSVLHLAASSQKKICLNCHKTISTELKHCSCGCTEFRPY